MKSVLLATTLLLMSAGYALAGPGAGDPTTPADPAAGRPTAILDDAKCAQCLKSDSAPGRHSLRGRSRSVHRQLQACRRECRRQDFRG